MSSFRAYGKVDELEHVRLEARRRTRRNIAIIVFSAILLAGVVVAAVLGTASARDKNNDNSSGDSFSSSIKVLCSQTQYPDSCNRALAPLENNNGPITPQSVTKALLLAAIDELSLASNSLFDHIPTAGLDNITHLALQDCQEMFNLSMNHLNMTLTQTQMTFLQAIDDLLTWMSTAGTYQQTCADGLREINTTLADTVSAFLQNTTEFISNGLAMVNLLSQISSAFKVRRKLMGSEPEWVTPEVRKLLATDLRSQAKIVVAKDGSGHFRTITDAVNAVPNNSPTRTIIYVKAGTYVEKVAIGSDKTNIVMVGDGMGKTIVTGHLNFVDGTPTFQSATFAVVGSGFIARDMAFQNTAGAIKQQAVALRSGADMSIFYRCTIDAFQDTLYTHSNRQFYRECNILGTVDFIFGNSAVVFQLCNILPRLPLLGQEDTITAQGRFDPNQNTGISIHDCVIVPLGNLNGTAVYLGRPWKVYSRTVYLKNYLGGFINPAGWLPWTGTSGPPTIFYAEFQNRGPGSPIAKRVKWKGVFYLNNTQANKFTVASFIRGTTWIPSTGVPFVAGL